MKDRSQCIWLIFAAGEVKESTVCGPLIVLPRTITTEGYFTNFDTTPLGEKTLQLTVVTSATLVLNFCGKAGVASAVAFSMKVAC